MREGQFRATARVIDVGMIEPKESGQWPSLAIQFEYESEEGARKTITDYRYFTDKALPYTEAALRTLGWDPIEHSWDIQSMLDTRAIVGAEASLVIEPETYEGKTRLKVKFVDAVGGMGKKADVEIVSDFTRALQKKLGFAPRSAARPAATKPAPRSAAPAAAAPAADDDGIPF